MGFFACLFLGFFWSQKIGDELMKRLFHCFSIWSVNVCFMNTKIRLGSTPENLYIFWTFPVCSFSVCINRYTSVVFVEFLLLGKWWIDYVFLKSCWATGIKLINCEWLSQHTPQCVYRSAKGNLQQIAVPPLQPWKFSTYRWLTFCFLSGCWISIPATGFWFGIRFKFPMS